MKERIKKLVATMFEHSFDMGVAWNMEDFKILFPAILACRENRQLILVEFEGLEKAFQMERDATIKLAAELERLANQCYDIKEANNNLKTCIELLRTVYYNDPVDAGWVELAQIMLDTDDPCKLKVIE